MEYRTLEITVASARDLKDVNLMSKMDVYASVSVKGDPVYSTQKHKTHVDKDCGPNPTWNYTIGFNLDEAALQQNRLTLKFELKSDRMFADKEIGEVHVPIKELFDQSGGDGDGEGKVKVQVKKDVSYAVRTSSGKQKGTLNFSFKFGDKCAQKHDKNLNKAAAGHPVVAYPPAFPLQAGSSSVPPPPQVAYPPYPPHAYPPQPYPYPPPQPAYAAYPPAPAPGYAYPGYPPQQYGGGYLQQPQKKKSGAGKMALGVGAGLLGGLLVGEVISDVGDMASYDSGYDAGFGDAGGFDF